jgi:O-antigen ligase
MNALASRFNADRWIPIGIALWASMLALAPSIPLKCSIAAVVAVPVCCWWLLGLSHRWLVTFLLASMLLPPLPIAIGDSGPHVSVALLPFGLAVALLQPPEWKRWLHPVSKWLLLFSGSLAISLGFAAVYSGPLIALGSAFRLGLFLVSPFLFFHVLGATHPLYPSFIRILFRAAIAGALFACLDFHYQFPAPAGYGAQFIWLSGAVLRRAQGVFYEASTLGNFCAFFLVMVLVTFVSRRDARPCSRIEAALGSLVLGAALIFSYSRGSLLNVACACIALICLRARNVKAVLGIVFALLAALVAVHYLFPALGESYWTRLQASFLYIQSAPDGTLSGRLSSWNALFDFVKLHPWKTLFGVGYKTLPYSPVAGQIIIVDNTFLELLVETGALGLFTFIVLNQQILKYSFRASGSLKPNTAFFGTWIFCFWVGEVVQMFSGDLITYWRVLPLYFTVLALALRNDQAGGPLRRNRLERTLRTEPERWV